MHPTISRARTVRRTNPRRLALSLAVSCILASGIFSTGAQAEGTAPADQAADSKSCSLCPPFGPDRPPLRVQPLDTPTQATADHAQFEQNGTIQLKGDARIVRPADRITGNQLTYQKQPEERITGTGDLWYETPDFTLNADHGWLEPQLHQGELNDTRYWLNSRRASGSASRVEQHSESTYQLFTADYSTCPPAKRAWDISAKQIDLDRESGRGQAYDAVLHAGGVPIFYFPYFNFPIDNRRQSGLLFPTFGSSTSGGIEYVQPYYWNIAPNMDATISPHVFTRRGLGLDTEFRYLHRFGQTGVGYDQVNLFWLPNDRVYGEKRWALTLKDQAQVTPNLSYALNVNRVSDQQFFRDFSTNLNQATTDYLPTQFNLNATTGGWSLGLMALQYQTVNPLIPQSAYPYRTMPRITASKNFDLGLADLSLVADATRFSNPYSSATTGQRLHVAPSLYHEFRDSWYEITPKLTLDATGYQLTRGLSDPLYQTSDPQEHPTRVLPITSLDSKLFFERSYGETGRYRAQLEPRLYYLNVPYRDQTNIPLFDTGLTNLSYSQLFTANRFSGGDRISDANALTYGVSWSLIDTVQGTEPLSLRIAQRYNFRESRVIPTVDKGGSTVVAEAYSDINKHWNGSFTAEYDSDSGHIGRTQTRLGYRADQGSVANVSYFTKPQDTTQAYRQGDVSFAWQTSLHWQVLGRLGYDFNQNKVVQSLLGVGYDSCCWAARVALKRYVVNPDTFGTMAAPKYSNAILFEVELKGLGSFGQKNRFQQEILGYDQ
ncbi:MAG: LPS-assembly protein LptD [Halothiobacillus sp.]